MIRIKIHLLKDKGKHVAFLILSMITIIDSSVVNVCNNDTNMWPDFSAGYNFSYG